MPSNVLPFRPPARALASACLRRARQAAGLSQEGLAIVLGVDDRTVRRRESGRCDLGVIEAALRNPEFAAALGRELLRVAKELSPRLNVEEREAA